MSFIALLCCIIGITRICNGFKLSNDFIKDMTKNHTGIEINPDFIKFMLIGVGIIETLCGGYIWFKL